MKTGNFANSTCGPTEVQPQVSHVGKERANSVPRSGNVGQDEAFFSYAGSLSREQEAMLTNFDIVGGDPL
eukprot:12900216-Prorocentrum_lima.AAC.1